MSAPEVKALWDAVADLFPLQYRRAVGLLVRYRLVEPERRLGPWLRNAIDKAGGDAEDLRILFSWQVPLAEAAGLLLGLEALESRIRLAVGGSSTPIARAIDNLDVFAIVELAFAELSTTD